MAIKKKPATLQFQCDPAWKRQVASIVALRGQTLQTVCVEAVSRYLKISAEKAA